MSGIGGLHGAEQTHGDRGPGAADGSPGPVGEGARVTSRRDALAAARAGLSRERIVQAGIDFVDADGLNALSMRALGKSLGVEAMAIYHWVNGREDLLDAMVARLMEQVRVPPGEPLGEVDGWQGYLQQFATGIRTSATEHPNLFPLVATRPPQAPWLRPPLRHLGMVEDFLNALLLRGLGPEQTAHVYKVFSAFLLGQLLLEVSVLGAELSPPQEPLDEVGAAPDNSTSLEGYPTLTRLREQLVAQDPDEEFVTALEALLDRLDSEISQ